MLSLGNPLGSSSTYIPEDISSFMDTEVALLAPQVRIEPHPALSILPTPNIPPLYFEAPSPKSYK